jgi:hypothetical protein
MTTLSDDQVIHMAIYYVENFSILKETSHMFDVGTMTVLRAIEYNLPLIPGMKTLYHDAMLWKHQNLEDRCNRGGYVTSRRKIYQNDKFIAYRRNPRSKYMKKRNTILTVSPELFSHLKRRCPPTKFYRIRNSKTGEIV